MKGGVKKKPAKEDKKARLGGGVKPLTGGGGIFKSAAVAVLRMERKLMTTGEITKTALKKGLVKCQGKTPDATMASALYTDIKRKLDQSVFTRPQEGLFGLREWIEEGFFPEGWEGPADGLGVVGVAPFKKRSNSTWTPESGKMQLATKRSGRGRPPKSESYVVPDDEIDDEETEDKETEDEDEAGEVEIDGEETEDEEVDEGRGRRSARKRKVEVEDDEDEEDAEAPAEAMPWLKSGTRGRRPSAKVRSSAEMLVDALMSGAAEIGAGNGNGQNEGHANGQALDWDLAVAAAAAVAGGNDSKRRSAGGGLHGAEPASSNGTTGMDSGRMRRRPKLLVDVNTSAQPDAEQPMTLGLLSLGLSTPSLFQGLDTPLLMPDSVTGLGGNNMFAHPSPRHQPSPRLLPSPRLRASTASPTMQQQQQQRQQQQQFSQQQQHKLQSPRETGAASSLPHIPELNLSLNISSLPSPGPLHMDQLNTPAMMALPLEGGGSLGGVLDIHGGQGTNRGGNQMGSIFSPSGLLSGFTPRFSDLLVTSKGRHGNTITGIFKGSDGQQEGGAHQFGATTASRHKQLLESLPLDGASQQQQALKYAHTKLAEADKLQDVVSSLETRLGHSHPMVGKAWLTVARMFHHISDTLPASKVRAAAALQRAVDVGSRCADALQTSMECGESVGYLRTVVGAATQQQGQRERTPA